MRTVQVPKFFHELLGKKTTLMELMIIILFTLIASSGVLIITANEWQVLKIYQIIVLVILMLDIYGGVIANFTYSTNEQYSRGSNKSRLIFLAIHIQPIILTLVLREFLMASLIVWAITIAGALIVNAYKGRDIQHVIGGLIMVINILIVILFLSYLPKYLLILYMFYVIKVCFSFAVDHYAKGEKV